MAVDAYAGYGIGCCCTFEDEDSQVRLDEAARRLILIRHREFVALPLGSLGQPPSAATDDTFDIKNVRG